MSAASITFRCYQCNKLLGVSRSRAGAVVTCPKCAAELLVPQPAETSPPAAPAAVSEAVSAEPDPAALIRSLLEPRAESTPPVPPPRDQPLSIPGDPPPPLPDAGSPAAFFPAIATEPESLRPDASAGRSKSVGRTKTGTTAPSRPPSFQPPTAPAADAPSPVASLFGAAPAEAPPPEAASPAPFPLNLDPEPVSLRPEAKSRAKPAPPAPPEVTGASFPPPPATEETALPTMEFATEGLRRPSASRNAPAPSPPRAVEPSTVPWPSFEETPPSAVVSQASPGIATVPEPVRAQPTAGITDRSLGGRRDDIAMPRTAVVLWSFFVLMSLVIAFAAGLLAGHFVWK